MSGPVAVISSIVLMLCCAPAFAVKSSSGPILTSTFPSREQLFKNVRTIDCKGKRVESFGNHCSSRGSNPGCASSYDVCYVKSGTHSQCRPVDRMLPTCWDAIEVVKCRGDSLPKIPPGPMLGRACEPRLNKIHKQVHGKADKHDAHDHDQPSPSSSNGEGTNCRASDLAKGCTCAGKFWRCADKDDLITKACDQGLECVRKNFFYAVCATPARKKWAVQVAGWEGTAVPCGVNVGNFGFSAAKAAPGGFAIASVVTSGGGKSSKSGKSHGKSHSKKQSKSKKSSKKKHSKKSSKKKHSKKSGKKKHSKKSGKKHSKKHGKH